MADAEPSGTDRTFSFKSWPFYWLVQANGRYLRNLEVALKGIALDIPRWRVLMSLHEESCASVSEIADHAIVKLSTMTRIVQRMQADGLVTCHPRDTDGRVTEVKLTDKGEAAGREAWAAANRTYDLAFQNIGKAEIEGLIRLLRRVSANLGETRP